MSQQTALSDSRITTALGGARNDPEGVAAPAAVKRITWKDARGADRTAVLGPYLYQCDFTFDDNQQVVTRSANDDAYGHEGFGRFGPRAPRQPRCAPAAGGRT